MTERPTPAETTHLIQRLLTRAQEFEDVKNFADCDLLRGAVLVIQGLAEAA